MRRCNWGNISEKMICYHDEEWGIPVHDDKVQFEYLMLEVMQCGLSWNLMIDDMLMNDIIDKVVLFVKVFKKYVK